MTAYTAAAAYQLHITPVWSEQKFNYCQRPPKNPVTLQITSSAKYTMTHVEQPRRKSSRQRAIYIISNKGINKL